MTTNLESIVIVLIFNFFRIYQESSCIAPKWHAHPQKNRPKSNVMKNENITRITPELITPSLRNE